MIKFEAARIHFSTDVFVVVAVLVAYTLPRVVHFSPLSTRERCLIDIFVDNIQSGLVREDKYVHCKSENLFLYTLSIRKICLTSKNWAISMSSPIFGSNLAPLIITITKCSNLIGYQLP